MGRAARLARQRHRPAARSAVAARRHGAGRRHRFRRGADKLAKPDFAVDDGHAAQRVPAVRRPHHLGRNATPTRLSPASRRRCPFPTRFHCYRTGLGAENAELFDALTRNGGGVFNCFSEADIDRRRDGASQSVLAPSRTFVSSMARRRATSCSRAARSPSIPAANWLIAAQARQAAAKAQADRRRQVPGREA